MRGLESEEISERSLGTPQGRQPSASILNTPRLFRAIVIYVFYWNCIHVPSVMFTDREIMDTFPRCVAEWLIDGS